MTVYENVKNGVISKVDKRFRCVSLLHRDKGVARQTEEMMELFTLTDVRDVLASELSYGRQRHLELALAITRDPALIMLDEPTAGLNSEESRDAVQLIKRITEGKTLRHWWNMIWTLSLILPTASRYSNMGLCSPSANPMKSA